MNFSCKRPSYETDLKAEIAIDGCWYHGTIKTISFPSHPSSPKPDTPCALEFSIGSDNYEAEIIRYADEIIYAKLGTSKEAKRVMIVL